jgi:hypothetical protein
MVIYLVKYMKKIEQFEQIQQMIAELVHSIINLENKVIKKINNKLINKNKMKFKNSK